MLDAEEIKAREHDSWQSVAPGWHRRDELLRKGGAPVTRWMIERARLESGHRVLDIASGTGEPAISAAQAVGSRGEVLGTDLVEEMLHFARDKAAQAGLENIEFRCVDGEMLDLPNDYFDAVTIRWGLMFMPRPDRCLTAVRGSLKADGRLSVACWAEPQRNPFVGTVMAVLGNYMEVPVPDPDMPGIFAFADPERLRMVIESAGFRDIAIECLELDDFIEVESGRAYWEAISDLAAPVMTLVDRLDTGTREQFIQEVIETADALEKDGVVRLRGTTWVASAVR